MRLCLVSPYAWDRPQTANDHWSALARALAAAGHEVVVLAPARSAAPLREGRRRLRALERGDATALRPPSGRPLVVPVGVAVPLRPGGGPAGGVPLPVAVRAGVRLALEHGRFDVVDALDPDLPGVSAIALRESPAPVVATFFRTGPPVRTARGAERLVGRADAVLAVTEPAALTVRRRFGLHARVTGVAVDAERFAPGTPAHPALVAVEPALPDRPALRALFAELDGTDAEVALLRVGAAAVLRPVLPAGLAGRVRVVDASTPAARASVLREAAVFVAGSTGSVLLAREAAACGVPVVAPAGSPAAAGVEADVSGLVAPAEAPAMVAALVGRLLSDPALRGRLAAGARRAAERSSAAVVARDVLAVYDAGRPPRRAPRPTPERRLLCDFHMHTEHSPDSTTTVEELVERAVEVGLGAIAVTDHNTVAGGVAARRYVEEHDIPLHVVVGSEIKTATGEVIGLYLQDDVPRGMPFADTLEAIHAQGAVVYVPHPFDRLHAIADPALLRRLVDQIDVFEVYNGKLFREAFNREAERFAARHDLLAGAGSDAHVPEGVGTGAVELPPFDDPESLLLALGSGRVVRRPANILALQGRKWLRQARRGKKGGELPR